MYKTYLFNSFRVGKKHYFARTRLQNRFTYYAYYVFKVFLFDPTPRDYLHPMFINPINPT